MSLTKVSYSMINGPVANIVDFGADPTGVADSYAAIKAAYDSNAAIIQLPAGTFKMSQTLVLGRGVVFNGSGAQDGSGNNGESAGVASTVINFTGTGNAIEVGASYTEQVSSIIVSNLMITGNSSASGGLFVGTLTGANKCTFSNLGIFNFTNTGTNLGYGVGIRNAIECIFENIYVHGCHDGFNLGFGACTSLEFRSCYSRVNSRYGWLMRQGNGMSLYQCLAEGNNKTGLVINADNGQNVSQISFYSWYSEYNAVDADTYPGVSVIQTGTGAAASIFFYSPSFYDYSTYNYGTNAWTISLINLGAVNSVKFYSATCVSVNPNFITCAAGTLQCEWNGNASDASSLNITNNTFSNNALLVNTVGTQTPGFVAFKTASVTDAFTTAWTIPDNTCGQLMVKCGATGQYGGVATFMVNKSPLGNAGAAAMSTFVGDVSGYTISWQLSGNNFQLHHNQAGQTITANLYFMPVL